jgi:hypothetical protein
MLAVLSVLAAAAPLVFGLIRYMQTGSDLRMLWMACAALACALVLRVAGGVARSWLAGSTLTLVAATLCAGAAGLLVGAPGTAGMWAVAIVFGLCLGASYAFSAIPRASTARR